MSGLITGVAQSQLGPALQATAEDWSHSSDQMALAQLHNQGMMNYGNALFNSRDTVAQIQADSRERVRQMADENAQLKGRLTQQFDPVEQAALETHMSVPEVQAYQAAQRQGGQTIPLPPDQAGPPQTSGFQPNPTLDAAIARNRLIAATGGNMQQVGEGAGAYNKALAPTGLVGSVSTSTDPTKVDQAVRASAGQPLAEGSANGVVDPTNPNAGTNATVNQNAGLRAQADVDRAAGAAKDTNFVRANAVLQASQKRLQELDAQATQVQRAAVTPPQQRAAQAQLAAIAQERQQVQAQYDQARTVIMPGASAGINPAERFWRQ
jgi:hypothetical protein